MGPGASGVSAPGQAPNSGRGITIWHKVSPYLHPQRLRRVARNVGNLSGLFFLFDPLSAVGFMIAQVVGQIPYILLGITWGLSKKHEVFATAGQDAFAMISAFLVPRCIIHVADAAAIKVRLLYICRIECFDLAS
ncbi:hypothetical protein BGY98DRAFT_479247 [Russula aff. rugulosa BPL654]|nr:hypothetical protein BGY98DRAFT_479247 [Russula aff. rugulosa BPL654]